MTPTRAPGGIPPNCWPTTAWKAATPARPPISAPPNWWQPAFARPGSSRPEIVAAFFQSVPLHEVAVQTDRTSFTLLHDRGSEQPIAFLQQITINAAPGLPPETEAPLTFRGYCGQEAMKEVDGKIVVCFGTQRQGLPNGAERVANARAGRCARDHQCRRPILHDRAAPLARGLCPYRRTWCGPDARQSAFGDALERRSPAKSPRRHGPRFRRHPGCRWAQRSARVVRHSRPPASPPPHHTTLL